MGSPSDLSRVWGCRLVTYTAQEIPSSLGKTIYLLRIEDEFCQLHDVKISSCWFHIVQLMPILEHIGFSHVLHF